jgi:hypothetical protein
MVVTEVQEFTSTLSARLLAGLTRDVGFLGVLDDAVLLWVLLGEEVRDSVGGNGFVHTTQS